MATTTNNTPLSPDFLFEVSWEICNKVGGIHTVIATKAQTVCAEMKDRYILIGPDINQGSRGNEFEEDQTLLKAWRQTLHNDGIRARVGRWKVNGNPIVVLVDFSQYYSQKDNILKELWETYHVDSISGQWDYIEPVLFGYAAAKVIESYIANFCSPTDRTIAHFHEWMTASGGLYLRKYAPYTATVFSTHATVMGRSIAGNNLPLYSNLSIINADDYARQFNVTAKHSIEKTAASKLDCFCTVSDITAKECKYLLGTEVDIVTPNGFENDFVWQGVEFHQKRADARKLMIRVAEACLSHKFEQDPLIVGTSGRYEFKNKGLDVLLEALNKIAAERGEGREILAYITVPAGNYGPRKDLAAALANNTPVDPHLCPHTTHYLSEPNTDPILNAMKETLLNDKNSRVKVIFVPSYLQGNDGIFNKQYYELLAGMDITVFASYYEPWGYTPLESIAFSVPTITTSLAGFGVWVDEHTEAQCGVEVIPRTDTNDDEVVTRIADSITKFAGMPREEYEECRESARQTSNIALWKNLIRYYHEAYDIALRNSTSRNNKAAYNSGGAYNEQVNFVKQQLANERPAWTRVMVEMNIPERLRPLEILSRNLWWSWTLDAHELFQYVDSELWEACSRNPIRLLDRLSYKRLRQLENDPSFLEKLDSVYAEFNKYMAEKQEAKGPNIAYFSMEYGLLNALKLYSGGLGILAGDYLKEASDKNVPMVAVGLLYRYGYFTQKITNQGLQEAEYEAQDFDKIPISPARDEEGNWCSVHIAFPGRTITARIWKCEVGRTDLYLLDTDHDLNMEEDRYITHYLYGGDWENRLRQEILLGVGGIRALSKLGIKSDIYHCNEGHAAFIGIERIHKLMDKKKLSFSEAMEVVRSSSLFTTHTPVPAGHDAFPESMIRQYMSHYPARLGITWEQFINLGKTNPSDPNEKFSMSVLACNLSQEVNGVSMLHGEVSKDILGHIWPGYFRNELDNIGYVTNGVHFPSWTAKGLRKLYSKYFAAGFSQHEYDIPAWQKVHDIPDEEFWRERMLLKERLINVIRERLDDTHQTVAAPNILVRMHENLSPKKLTIGFARRFATYKRAAILFTDLDRLSAIVNNKEYPVQFIFAGKAHPNDIPGQELIKRIVEVASMPEFLGKIIFLTNYDIELARRMVQGVDVWLNTPVRSQEASGTSGEKAVMNGVMHFSVLDGWWVEGYKKGAGWMLPQKRTYADESYQNALDAELIYRTIEDEIVPLYYTRDKHNLPHEWISTMKRCVADVASNFTTNRMLDDYQRQYYIPLYERSSMIEDNDFTIARQLAAWKRKVSNAWDNVKIVRTKQIDISKEAIVVNAPIKVEVVLDIDCLQPDDIGVELIVARQIEQGHSIDILDKIQLIPCGFDGQLTSYCLDFTPKYTGTFDVALRVYPKHPHLAHRTDFALVKWI